ncbi:MAG: sigma 54-interacting transcriptional regulator [Acidobacteriaceae bacterium]|nr:sigma 54-interacting transcriptional regulator [Acidobacteriaceae bacterium]
MASARQLAFGQKNQIQRSVGDDVARLQALPSKRDLDFDDLCPPDATLDYTIFDGIIGCSEALRRTLHDVAQVAPTDSTVLIAGETGTGKELVARAIHKGSRRARHSFVSVNCAAIPQTLIASELFGHEKGAFTGATDRRRGRFEIADGGTIFLDEIGDIPPDTQVALLRVLQEREFERVGANNTLAVDVRVVAATNQDLRDSVDSGTFRADLFYRLNVFPIRIPSLRERPDDIPLLTKYFVERYATRAGKTITKIDQRTFDLLQAYHWPGNVRELQNVIERAVILCSRESLSINESWVRTRRPEDVLPLTLALVDREKHMIEAALEESRGRVSGPYGAATKLRIPRSTLESKIRTLGIDKYFFKCDARASDNILSGKRRRTKVACISSACDRGANGAALPDKTFGR